MPGGVPSTLVGRLHVQYVVHREYMRNGQGRRDGAPAAIRKEDSPDKDAPSVSPSACTEYSVLVTPYASYKTSSFVAM